MRTGETRLLRGTAAHEMRPVWLADGRTIAFAADTAGSYDVYAIAADGSAEPARLTWHARHEIPAGASPDGTSLLVRSGRLDVDGGFAAYSFQLEGSEDESWPAEWVGLFSQPLAGGLPRPLVEPASPEGTWDAAAERLAFSVRPGTGSIYRKHERSPAAWDIWLRERDGRTFRRLTAFEGNDTTPVWSPADGHIYFLSERSGSFNVWRMPPEGDAHAEQITHHADFPVRGLAIAASGDIAYGFRGELYAGRPGGRIARVPVRLPARAAHPQTGSLDLGAAIREAVLVPATREAIITARGAVHAVDCRSNRRRELFAGYPGAKSSPTLSADGRRLLVVHDRGDASELLLAELPAGARAWSDDAVSPRVIAFARTAELILRAVLSPDGARAALVRGLSLEIAHAEGGAAAVRAAHAQGLITDGRAFAWHPAGRHLALEWSNLQRREPEVAVLDTADGTFLNVSRSAFADSAPRWSPGGRALLWLSDRDGLRQFDGEHGQTDVHALFLDPAARRAHEKGRDSPGTPLGADELARLLEALRASPERLSEQRVRLSGVSARNLAFALAPSGRYLLRLEEPAGAPALSLQPLPEGEDQRVWRLALAPEPVQPFESVDSIEIAADEREALVLAGGTARWIELGSGRSTKVDLREIVPRAAAVEQRWVFEHVVRAAERLYYRPDHLAASGWRGQVAEHRRLLAAVTHPVDFAELVGELLGELGASHTAFHYKRPLEPRMGSLGAVYDPEHRSAGFRLAEVLPASPLMKAAEARAGELIVRIGEAMVPAGADPARLLAVEAGKEVTIGMRAVDGTERVVRVMPIGLAEESRLFYRRWVERRRYETERLSGGRLGYVHLPWMEEDTFRALVDETLGELVTREGIVLDLRYNQGGWLHGPLLAFLAARFAFALQAHGAVVASEPALRLGRPFVVLVNTANYSNGYEVPRLLQEQGIAVLVGEPVAGTGLGGAGAPLPYPEFTYAIAHDVSLAADGQYWEGTELRPEVIVLGDRAAARAGRDVQLEAAVATLLDALD